MINESARKYEVVIGGVDYSAQMVSFTGTTAHMPGGAGGLCNFEGEILLDEGSQPIDTDTVAGLFSPKTIVTLRVGNTLGVLENFPHQLKVKRAAWDSSTKTTVLQVGDALSLEPERQPTDIYVTGVQVGTPLSASLVITNCLNAIGVVPGTISLGGPITLLTPPEISKGSYLNAVGDFLDASRTVGWMDPSGNFRGAAIDLLPQAATAVVTPSDFVPVDLGQNPAEELTVTGSFNYVYQRNNPPQSSTSTPEQTVTVSNSYSFSSATQTIETETQLLGTEIYDPVRAGGGGPYPTGKTLATRVTDTTIYEQANSGKLLQKTVETDIRKVLAHNVFAGKAVEIDAENSTEGTVDAILPLVPWTTLLNPGRKEVTTWQYSSDETIQKITKTAWATVGEILGKAGSSANWELIDSLAQLDDLIVTEVEEETWIRHGPRDWEVRPRLRISRAGNQSSASNTASQFSAIDQRLSNGDIDGPTQVAQYSAQISQALELIEVEPRKAPDRQSDGSLSPPETTRKPSRYYAEAGQAQVAVNFVQANPQGAPRTAGASVPVLPDANGDATVIGPGVAQAAAIAWGQVKGAIEFCRAKGRQVKAPIPDGFLNNFRPWMAFDVRRDGKTYRMAADGVTWTFNRSAAYFECDAPLLGTGEGVAPTTITPPWSVGP